MPTAAQDTAEYFYSLLSLYASCVRGRNLRVTPTLQRLLPYEVLLAVITDRRDDSGTRRQRWTASLDATRPA